jgi:hypothetical protein
MAIALSISEYDFTCGAPLADPNIDLLRKVEIRRNITCAHPVELPFYSAGGNLQVQTATICCYCASDDGIVDQSLKSKYKTVLPICKQCKDSGKSAFVQRPYGHKK